MRLPAVMRQIGILGFSFAADLCRRIAFKRSVNATVVIVFLEYAQLFLQVDRVPKKRMIKELATNRSDQALNKGMGNGCIGDALDRVDFKDAEVRLPSVILEKWIVVRA